MLDYRTFHPWPWFLELYFVLHGQGWLVLLWRVWVDSGWLHWQHWTVFHPDGLQTRNSPRQTHICDQPQRKKTANGKKREGEVMKSIFRAEKFVHNHSSDNKDRMFISHEKRHANEIRYVYKRKPHTSYTNKCRKITWIFNLQRINFKMKKKEKSYYYLIQGGFRWFWNTIFKKLLFE